MSGASSSTRRLALVLTGGGARAAYQVGVLQAIREMLPDPRVNPFPIICGTSAGAVNAASLAVSADNYDQAVRNMHDVWANFHANHVYRTDPFTLTVYASRWLGLLAFGWVLKQNPRSVLDNTPLAKLLARTLDFSRIDQVIARGALYAVSVTATGYATGQSITFYQGASDIEPWRRTQRQSARVQLTVRHLLASAAIPFVFPAIKVNREYFGDGSMRQLAPISPAIHLGADRILVVGAGNLSQESTRDAPVVYPSPAQIAGHALASIFLDGLAVDLERVEHVNRMLSRLPADVLASGALGLRPIETLVISPSERLDLIAAEHARALPPTVRRLLKGLGATKSSGSMLTSYLLFEVPFTRALIDLGYRDTLARRDEIARFVLHGSAHRYAAPSEGS